MEQSINHFSEIIDFNSNAVLLIAAEVCHSIVIECFRLQHGIILDAVLLLVWLGRTNVLRSPPVHTSHPMFFLLIYFLKTQAEFTLSL